MTTTVPTAAVPTAALLTDLTNLLTALSARAADLATALSGIAADLPPVALAAAAGEVQRIAGRLADVEERLGAEGPG